MKPRCSKTLNTDGESRTKNKSINTVAEKLVNEQHPPERKIGIEWELKYMEKWRPEKRKFYVGKRLGSAALIPGSGKCWDEKKLKFKRQVNRTDFRDRLHDGKPRFVSGTYMVQSNALFWARWVPIIWFQVCTCIYSLLSAQIYCKRQWILVIHKSQIFMGN